MLTTFKRNHPWCNYAQFALLALIVTSILWRGGKSIDMTWLLAGVAIFAVYTSYLHHNGRGNISVPMFYFWLVIGLIGMTGLSYTSSSVGNYGLDEVVRTASLGLLFLWILREVEVIQQNPLVYRILKTIAYTTLLACIIGFVIYTLQPVNRFVGTFFDYRFHTDYWPNAWAQFLLLTWPIVLYFTFVDFTLNVRDRNSRLELLVRITIIGIILGCILLTYSRGATLALLAQIGIWASLIYAHTKPTFPMRSILPRLTVVIIAGVLVFIVGNSMRAQIHLVQDVSDKVTLQAAEGGSSVTERLDFWQQAAVLSVQKIALGYGPYSFRFVQPRVQTGVLQTSDHPHNVLLKLLMERGVITMLIFSVLVFSILYRSAMLIATTKLDKLHTVVLLGVCGVLLHNFIDYNLQFVGIALPFWLLLGICANGRKDQGRKMHVRTAKIIELSVATLLAVIILVEGSFLVTSSLGRHAEKRGDKNAAVVWYERSKKQLFSRDLLLSLAMLQEPESAQYTLAQYKSINPHDYRARRLEGDIALKAGDYRRALRAYEDAFVGGQWNDLGIVRGFIEAAQQLEDTAIIDQKKADIDALITAYKDAIANNSHFIALSSNVEEFVIVCNKLASLYPDEAPVYQVLAANADHHAQLEREKIKSRPAGYLW